MKTLALLCLLLVAVRCRDPEDEFQEYLEPLTIEETIPLAEFDPFFRACEKDSSYNCNVLQSFLDCGILVANNPNHVLIKTRCKDYFDEFVKTDNFLTNGPEYFADTRYHIRAIWSGADVSSRLVVEQKFIKFLVETHRKYNRTKEDL